MKRRDFAALLAALPFGAATVAEAQKERIARLGFLSTGRAPTPEERARSPLRIKLRELGWVEGRNLEIEHRYAASEPELRQSARELAGLRLDAIFAAGSLALRAAMQETATTPIVMFTVGDPVASGWVRNLARPEGNVTGVAGFARDLAAKRAALLREIDPRIRTVAVLGNPANARLAEIFKDLQERTRATGLEFRLFQIASPDALEQAFAAMAREKIQGMTDVPDPMLGGQLKRIVELAARNRLPAIYESASFADAGGLLAYGPDYDELARGVAVYLDKILRGARPADLPVQFPTKFALVVNLKAAKALGLSIPQSVLLRADRVIE